MFIPSWLVYAASAKRTVKFMRAVALGKRIVGPSWITARYANPLAINRHPNVPLPAPLHHRPSTQFACRKTLGWRPALLRRCRERDTVQFPAQDLIIQCAGPSCFHRLIVHFGAGYQTRGCRDGPGTHSMRPCSKNTVLFSHVNPM